MRIEFSLVIDLISRFSLLYLSFVHLRRKRKGKKKEREANARTHIHIAFIHFFFFTDKRTHTHTRSLSLFLLWHYTSWKIDEQNFIKVRKFLSFRNTIISICLLLNRTNENWRKCLYWIRYQMQVSFNINPHNRKEIFLSTSVVHLHRQVIMHRFK